MAKVIEVRLTDIEERILEVLTRKNLGMTAKQISCYLEGQGWPLTSWQLGKVLRGMERLEIISRTRSGHVLRYKYITLTEINSLR